MRVPCPSDVRIESIPRDTGNGAFPLPDPETIKKQLEKVIEEARRVSGCRSVMVVRQDGLVIVHRVEQGHDPRLASAMTAAIFGTATFAAKELGQGGIERIMVECSDGKIIALGAGRDAVIVGLYRRNATLGLVLHGLAKAAEAVERILSGDPS